MELKPSTYYLDAIKAKQEQEKLAQQQEAVDVSEASEKAAQAQRIANEKAEQERQKRRIEAQKSMIQASFASMWGSDDAVVRKISESINNNLDQYVDNEELFQKMLATLDSFVDNSKSYYTGTSKSFLDATQRSYPGGKNPFETDGLRDARSLEDYETTAQGLDKSIPEVRVLGNGSIMIGDTSIDDYMSSRSGENADPFAPKLEPLPAITAQEIYIKNRGAINDSKNREAFIEKLLDEIISDPVTLGRLTTGIEGYESNSSKPVLIQKKRDDLKKELLGIISAGGIK